MSITINMSTKISVPRYNDKALTLVIFKNARLSGTDSIVRVNSTDELKEAFTAPTTASALIELYVAEYLTNSGVNLLCYSTEEVGTLAEADVTAIADQHDLRYRFILVPYDFIQHDGTTLTAPTDLMTKVKTVSAILTDNIDAELYLDLDPDFDITNLSELSTDLMTTYSSPKIEVFVNSGLLGISSVFETPAGFDGILEYSEGFFGIPASAATVVRKANLLAQGKPWIPVAGEDNGLIPEFSSLYNKISTDDKIAYQSVNFNVLINRYGVGNVLVSQNTLANTDSETNPLIRSHVVTEALWFKRQFQELANSTEFLPNNQKTWDLLELKLSDLFTNVLSQDGIEAYRVLLGKGITMTEEDIANGDIRVNLGYTPIRVVKDLEFNVTISDSQNLSELSVSGGEL